MIDMDLKTLAEQPPDHSLDQLEMEIWPEVDRQQRAQRATHRLLALQAVVLIVAAVGSLVAGEHQARGVRGGSLEVFSPQMPLSVSTLLMGNRP